MAQATDKPKSTLARLLALELSAHERLACIYSMRDGMTLAKIGSILNVPAKRVAELIESAEAKLTERDYRHDLERPFAHPAGPRRSKPNGKDVRHGQAT